MRKSPVRKVLAHSVILAGSAQRRTALLKGEAMKRSQSSWLALCVLLVTLFAVSGYAQFQTGNIYGKVQAKDGSVLPGVTITLTGVGAPQVAVSGPQGEFRFLSLSPGTYSVKADLAGYGSATRSGVGVRVAQNADVTMNLNP